MRIDHKIIEGWIQPNSKILDLGCGDGSLLAHLKDSKKIHGYGLEIDAKNIQSCIEKGVNVIEHDLDEGLLSFQDNSFDTVVMSYTLQTMQYPDKVLQEMMRIGKEGIVTFPNFGHWASRFNFLLRGRMPVSDLLPYEWYNTPNIHFCTFRDFEILCKELNFNVLNRQVVSEGGLSKVLNELHPNMFGETGIYRFTQ